MLSISVDIGGLIYISFLRYTIHIFDALESADSPGLPESGERLMESLLSLRAKGVYAAFLKALFTARTPIKSLDFHSRDYGFLQSFSRV